MTILFCILAILTQLPAGGPPPSAPAETDQVRIDLFSDFQCPFCARFAPSFRELQTEGVDGVRLAVEFKHFPLNIHPASRLAHQAALAAGEQGKFWEMHDLLFANQSAVKREDLIRYAAKLELDLTRFQSDLDSERIKKRIEADEIEAQRLHVQGTPTFFVNGKRYSGAWSLDELKQLVEKEQQRMRVLAEVPDRLLSQGSADAPVTLEFFADLESPITRQALDVLNQAIHKYPSKVRIQFRNFPLSFHPQAQLAHEAAMAAAAKDRFWEFASYILDHQDSLREQNLIVQAGRLGIDQEMFAQMLNRHHYAARVEADLEASAKRGIRGSPVVFVNGHRIDGVPGLEQLVTYIESELVALDQNKARRQ